MNYLLILFAILFVNPPTETTELTLIISNIDHIGGTLEIGIFNSGERFMESGQAYKAVSVEVEQDLEMVVVKGLPKGTYAISLYHDKNSNGKCDRNFLGIPKEPYAFSNNFKPKFSAPTFEDCKFELTADKSLNIKLIN